MLAVDDHEFGVAGSKLGQGHSEQAEALEDEPVLARGDKEPVAVDRESLPFRVFDIEELREPFRQTGAVGGGHDLQADARSLGHLHRKFESLSTGKRERSLTGTAAATVVDEPAFTG